MKPDTRTYYHQAVRRAVTEVLAGLDEALDLERLAATVQLSPFHFHRIFRGLVGETPLELQRRLRLERAAVQLTTGGTGVTTIAFGAGYETHESFTRAFRARYGMSPSEFRKAARNGGDDCAGPARTALASRSGIHFPLEASAVAGRFSRLGQETTTMDVTLKELPSQVAATLAHLGPYDRIGETFGRLGALAGAADLFPSSRGMIAIYHDDPETTPPAELRSEAGLLVPVASAIPPSLTRREVPAGRYATTLHRGPYATLGDTWARLMGEWLPASPHRMRDTVAFELYLNTPGTVPDDELLTELYIPLAAPMEGSPPA